MTRHLDFGTECGSWNGLQTKWKIRRIWSFYTRLQRNTQGTLVNLFNADGNKGDDFLIENSPNETEMANLIDSPTQVSLPVKSFASGTDGSLASNSQDVEAFAHTC